MEPLRQEILESQKARSDLLKWKVGLVAGLFAVGLGFNSGGSSHPIVVAAVPLVCVYVDVLCRHLNLRIQLIAEFTRSCCATTVATAEEWASTAIYRYEEYVPPRASAFVLEDWALWWSTLSLSTVVGVYGVVGHLFGVAPAPSEAIGILLVVSGAIGVVLSLHTENVYRVQRKYLSEHRDDDVARNMSK